MTRIGYEKQSGASRVGSSIYEYVQLWLMVQYLTTGIEPRDLSYSSEAIDGYLRWSKEKPIDKAGKKT